MPNEQLHYEYEQGCEVLPTDRIEEILRIGKIFARRLDTDVFMKILGDRIVPEQVPCVRCVMDGGLRTIFYPESSYAPNATKKIPIESLARRYRAVYEVSKRMGLEICPIAVIRSVQGLGRGFMIPVIQSKALVFVQMVDGRPRVSLRSENTTNSRVNQALVFDYMVGSGQKSWYGYQVDKNGKVYSPHHFLAFTFDMAGRIAGILVKRRSEISATFFRRLEAFDRRYADKSALIQELMILVGIRPTKNFDMILDRILEEKKLGDHVALELVEER